MFSEMVFIFVFNVIEFNHQSNIIHLKKKVMVIKQRKMNIDGTNVQKTSRIDVT